MSSQKETYAGDGALRQWFERCAVGLCGSDESALLKREIESAFNRELARHDLRGGDFGDICQYFDAHFHLSGTDWKKGVKKDAGRPAKALKAFLFDRIDPDDPEGLKKLVCGTVFSPQCGMMKDIVREAIHVEKGWRARYKNTPEGKKLYWECPEPPAPGEADGDEGQTREPVVFYDAFSSLDCDRDAWMSFADRLLDFLSQGSEKSRSEVPIQVYALLNGISPLNAAVQRLLGVKQVQCYKKFDKIKEQIRAFALQNDMTADDLADSLFWSSLKERTGERLSVAAREALEPEIAEEWR